MATTWIHSNPQRLVKQSEQMAAGMTAHKADIPLTNAQLTAFDDTVTTFASDVTAWREAKLAYEAAIQAKKTSQRALTVKMSTYGNLVQASPTVSNAQRIDIGVPVRKKSHTRILPQSVTGLIATPNAAGYLKLKFERGNNKSAVRFQVEGRAESGEWKLLANVSKTRVTLSGFAPGVPYDFRVIATSATASAQPSNIAVIYPESAIAAPRVTLQAA
ncbi:MAG: fibronectin type III domain-containing protein [Armatimonadetes bacterium]|nr:fibronectin type III domain-containing protein [Armatimonadota bacterium]